ncbi:hypothetical protein GCM10009765_30930 [Fodinicola feengrottensis]|uniref:Uncharacterized protein n=1 Tax=Fodinicola feengrottensis TaxID=435914 RepID=A0ABP4SYZ0_9ACTN
MAGNAPMASTNTTTHAVRVSASSTYGGRLPDFANDGIGAGTTAGPLTGKGMSGGFGANGTSGAGVSAGGLAAGET